MRRSHAGVLCFRAVARSAPVMSAALALLACTGTARADIFHLKSGGTIEGQLLETDGGSHKIRTPVGVVRVPESAVVSIEQSASPFAEYEQRAKEAADTPEGQTTLAAWCDEQGLRTERKRHLTRALELDPDYAPARHALGYARVGDLWIDGRTVADRPGAAGPAENPKETDPQRLARAIQGQWLRRIRALRQGKLESRNDRLSDQGRTEILNIKDPLAILPLAQVLSGGDARCRSLLVEALSAFPQDEATMNLAVMALLDPDDGVCQRAVRDLVRRADPRVVAQYRAALRSQSDTVVRRAAFALGEFAAPEAVPELVDALTVQRNKWVEVPVRLYLNVQPRVFYESTVVQLGPGTQAVHAPEIGVQGMAIALTSDIRFRHVTVYRTEVLEALKRITGQNFGFERDDWRRWQMENKG